jgi:hypothetical protein
MLDLNDIESYLRSMDEIRLVSVVRYDKRPHTLNAERRLHHMQRAKLAREWRDAFNWLARLHRLPRLEAAVVIVQPHRAKGPAQDADACHPAAKAAIDGLVDAGVLPSDGPKHLLEVRYMTAIPDPKDGLSLVICERSKR